MSFGADKHERYRAFIEQTSDGIWRFEAHKPVPIDLDLGELIDRLYDDFGLAECNEALARMYGVTAPELLQGTKLDSVLPRADARHRAHLEEFIKNQFRLADAESRAPLPEGEERVYLSSLYGVVEYGALVRIWGVRREITKQKRAEEALRRSEERYRLFSELASDYVYSIDVSSGSLLPEWVTDAFHRVTGYTLEDLKSAGGWTSMIHADDRAAADRYSDSIRSGKSGIFEYRIVTKSGQVRWLRDYVRPVWDALRGRVTRVNGGVQDITERKRLEEQLLHAQKMESIGRFAGGIAHDFNNLLTGILGYAELAAMKLPEDSPAQGDLDQIHDVAQRASSLVRQLLAFSRQQILEQKVVDLNELIQQTEALLRRVIGEDMELVTSLTPQVGFVKVDPGQFEQVLLNLAVNARDAMPQGGRLTIETAHVSLDEDVLPGYVEMLAGAYVMLAVSDTGVGMTADVLQHLFEPFFTTKEPGKGTGLGLATCYGIIRQNGGTIRVTSELGRGSTFRIYFPRVASSTATPPQAPGARRPLSGDETLLVVEDEAIVRAIAVDALRRHGYTVLQAGDGMEALRVAGEHAGNIDLLVTDVVMPQLGGRELARRLRSKRPKLRVLYVSGYTDSAIARHGMLEDGIALLQKPFTAATLTRKVRDALDAP